MFRFRLFDIDITVDPLFFSVLAFVFMAGKDPDAILALLAAAAHEAGHIAAMLLIGTKPRKLGLTPFGIRLELPFESRGSVSVENIIYMAGPGVNLLLGLLLVSRGFGRAAAANFFIAAFSLLPVGRLDGGCLLRNTSSLLFRSPPYALFVALDVFFLAAMLAAGAVLLWASGNPTLLFTSSYLAAAVISEST